MRCATYIRVSTDDQAERGYSLDSQRKALMEAAAERGYTVVLSERDDLSGTTLDRPGLRRIRDAAQAKLIDTVLVYDPDRLTRKVAHLFVLEEEFAAAGVSLEFHTQGPVKNSEDRLLLQVRGVIAEYERTKIMERTGRGLRERAKAGKWCGGPVPYGYEYAEGRLTISAATAPTVRKMFSWSASGVSIREIARRLNTSDARPSGGGDWQTSTINWMLRSEMYAGRAHYGPDRIALPIPAIVNGETFAAVSAQMTRNKALMSGRPSRLYILSGLCRCKCGSRMRGTASHGTRYYACRACGHAITSHLAERTVYESISSTIGSPEAIQALVVDHYERLRGENGDGAALLKRAEVLRRKAERGARSLIHAATDSEERVMRDELGKVRASLAEVEGRLAELGAAESAADSVESMRAEIAEALEIVADDAALRREFLRRVVQEVRVNGKKLDIDAKLCNAGCRLVQFSMTIHAEVA